MPFAYYKHLPARVRRIYDRSNEVPFVRLPAPERLEPVVMALARALHSAERAETELAAKCFCDAMTRALRISGVRVRVLAKRPSHSWGELHGLYEPEEGQKPLITVWMRTAQRRQVVAFKTFLRTILHEIGHHLDYELLELEDSLHTEGFYKRESNFFRQLVADPARYEVQAPSATPVAATASPGSKRTPAPRPKAKPIAPDAEQTRLPFMES